MLITIDDYFDLDKIILSGQTFRATKINEGLYRFISLDKVLYISMPDSNTLDVSCSANEWHNYWHGYFDLDRSYKDIPVYDDFTNQCYEYSKGIRILRQDPFEMLISFIISQRKSIPAIRRSIEAMCFTFGDKTSTPYEDNIHIFPSAKKIYDRLELLSECSLGYRQGYVVDAVSTVIDNPDFLDIGYSLDNEELTDHLMQIKGVGQKVANCVALFAYGRVSLAPIDTWINRIIDRYFSGRSPFTDYGDTAGIIQQYMFYYAITHKDEFTGI